MNIFEITGQMQQLYMMAEEESIDQKTINDTLEGLEWEFEEKAESYAKVLAALEADVEAIDRQVERLNARKRKIKGNMDSLKRNLEGAMLETGKRKFKTPLFSFGIQKNPPSLKVLDEKGIPEEFWKPQEPVLDRRAALDYIKKHGATEWGEMAQTESLRIR